MAEHSIFSNEGRETLRWWFSTDPKVIKQRAEFIQQVKVEEQQEQEYMKKIILF